MTRSGAGAIAIMIKVRYYCIRCQQEVPYPIDHRKPRSQGGSDEPENIQPLCDKHHKDKHRYPKAAVEEGLTLLRGDEERAWWRDFPLSVIPNPPDRERVRADIKRFMRLKD